MRPGRYIAAAVLLLLLAPPLPAQRRSASAIAPPLASADDSTRRRTPWAIVASAIVPGAGQALLGQKRSIAYAVIEGLLLMRYIDDSRAGRRSRDRYRLLAHDVARSPFAENRPVGNFDYYERMTKYEASGAFDETPGGGLDPQTDPATWNGAMWQLARETFWEDPDSPPTPDSPEYQRALALYRARAYDAAFQWSWAGATTEQDEFRRAIRHSNSEYRQAATDLGLLIANHVLSTVDAFVEVRLRRREGPVETVELRATLPFAVLGGRRRSH